MQIFNLTLTLQIKMHLKHKQNETREREDLQYKTGLMSTALDLIQMHNEYSG